MPSLYSSKSSTGWQLRADYSTEPDILNNRTLVSVELYVYAGTAGSWNANTSTSLSAYYTIYGTRKYLTYDYPTKGWKYLGSRDFYVSHNNDGTKTFTFTADWYSRLVSSYTPPSLNISASITLPRIPRASTISADSFTIGEAGNISINRADSSFTHRLIYSFGDESGLIGSDLDESAEWTPPVLLLSEIPTATSGICLITCETYSAQTKIGTFVLEVTLKVPNNVLPLISNAVITPVNANSWINEKGLYVGGFTKARIQTEAMAGQGASIKSITINGASASDDWTSAILTAGQKSFIIRVTDTRNRYIEKTVSAIFLEYSSPLFASAKAVRSNASGVEVDEGTYLYAVGEAIFSSLDGNNDIELELRIRESGESWQPYISIGNNEPYLQDVLLTMASYEVEITAKDLVGGTATRTFKIATAEIDFHLRHGGRGAAFGKYSEREGLEVDWDAIFYKDVEVDGAVTIGGNTIADYPIETGTDGIWIWEKWASGKAVCWGNELIETLELTTKMTDGVYSNSSYNSRTVYLPSDFFTNVIYAEANVVNGGYTHSQVSQVYNNAIVTRIWASYAYTVSGSVMSYYVIGKWK